MIRRVSAACTRAALASSVCKRFTHTSKADVAEEQTPRQTTGETAAEVEHTIHTVPEECLPVASSRTSDQILATTILPEERAEHDAFIAWCQGSDGLRLGQPVPSGPLKAVPSGTISSLKIAREEDEGIDLHLRRGRGLVAAIDVDPGTVLAAGSFDRCVLTAYSLLKSRAERFKLPGDGTTTTFAHDPFRALSQSIPTLDEIHELFQNLEVPLDSYHALQLELSIRLTIEKCDVETPYRPFLDVLPCPAIRDDLVLNAHASMLSTRARRKYSSLHTDWEGVLLGKIRSFWNEKFEKHCAQMKKDQNNDEHMPVPPLGVMQWAYRTVIGWQRPVLPNGDAPPFTPWRGEHSARMDFNTWVKIQRRSDEVVPALLPYFSLVDHSPIANAALEIFKVPIDPEAAAAVEDQEEEDDPLNSLNWAKKKLAAAFGKKETPIEKETIVQLIATKRIPMGAQVVSTFSAEDGLGGALYRFGFVPYTKGISGGLHFGRY